MTMRTKCPLCASSAIIAFATLDTREISKCTSCSLVFVSRFDEVVLARAYKEDYYAAPDDPRIDALIQTDCAVSDDLVSDLSRLDSAIKSLLDIGAGTGGFLLRYSQKNPMTKLYAIESSVEAKENLLRRIPALQIIEGAAENLNIVNNSFDAITCFQCLEHLIDPFEVCRQAHRLLARNGAFLLTVPNRLSYQELRGNKKKSLCYGNRTHLQFFSATTMKALLKQAGFVKIDRIVKLGGGHQHGIMAGLQYAMRALAVSTELRFVARKADLR